MKLFNFSCEIPAHISDTSTQLCEKIFNRFLKLKKKRSKLKNYFFLLLVKIVQN